MSNIDEAMTVLRQLGPSKAVEVGKLLPNLSAKQVRQALSNGKERNRCRLVDGLWVPLDEPMDADPNAARGLLGWMGMVNSVWQLAERQA